MSSFGEEMMLISAYTWMCSCFFALGCCIKQAWSGQRGGERDREIQYQIQKIGSERGGGDDGAIDCQMKRKMGGRTLGAVGKGTRNYFMAPARNLKRNPVCATP